MDAEYVGKIPSAEQGAADEENKVTKVAKPAAEAERSFEALISRLSSKVADTIATVVSPSKRRDFVDIAEVLPKSSGRPIENSWTVIEEKVPPRSFSLPQREDPAREETLRRFLDLLAAPLVDLDELRELCWNGIPCEVRAVCWQLMLGCLPQELKKRSQYSAFKRAEYRHLVSKHHTRMQGTKDLELLQQVSVDCPRTMPKGAPAEVFKDERVLKMLERILVVWSKENPSVDYFQGLGDIAGELLTVFLSAYLELQNYHPNYLTQEIADIVEPDTYWCMAKMLKAMDTYYSKGLFPGMQVMMDKMKELTKLADEPLLKHMESQGIEFVQFSLRWMLCLLTRELPSACIHRLWDSYLAEGPEFSTFHVYVCAAFLVEYSKQLREMEFAELITFLQHLPTDTWDERDAQRLIEKAYQIGDAEVSLKESYNRAIQATGLLVTLFVIVLATQAPVLKKLT